MWTPISRAIDEHDRFLVTTHVNSDGDGLGAELGLWGYLKSLGKDVRIVNPDALSERYAFLNRDGQYETFDPVAHRDVLADREVVFFLDFSRWERLGALGDAIRAEDALTVCIDHHPVDRGPGDLNGIDVTAAATGQLVYELIRYRGGVPDRRMATGLYVSILTDTGSFRFSNSDPRAHRVAAELLDSGLDPAILYENVYGNWELGRLRLLAAALTSLRAEDDGRILLLSVPYRLLVECGLPMSDTDGFVDVARSTRGAECVALFVEREDGSYKVSFRSRGTVNVNHVAGEFGGGGHRNASGATLDGPLEAAQAAVLAALRRALA
jgi:phosphoesterase RecJ-like protein